MTYEQYARMRDSKGFKDGTVAKIADIGRSTFSDWKAGRSSPKTDKLEKIRRALDIPITEFYSDESISTTMEVSEIIMQKAKENITQDPVDTSFALGVDDALILQKIQKLTPVNREVLKSTLDALLAAQGL